MPTGTFQGTFKVSGTGITLSTGGVAVLVGAGYAITHQKQAASAANGAATIAAITVGVVVAVAVAITAAVVYRRLRRRGSDYGTAPRPVPTLLRTNPHALPPRETRAIAPVVQPVININLGQDFAADVAAHLRAEPVPVYRVTAEPVEQQEIPR
jgi:hypothetical protein